MTTAFRKMAIVARRWPVSRVLLLSTLLVGAVLVERGSSAAAVAGYLDPTFGVGGQVTLPGHSRQETGSLLLEGFGVVPRAALALQPDSKVVVAGELDGGGFGVARLLPDGNLDSTFGVSGRVSTFAGSRAAATAVAVQPDGKVVVGGFFRDFFGIALVRYDTNGALDPTFVGPGPVERVSGVINAIALQHDGKIVWAGLGNQSIGRYLSTGARDWGFDAGCAPVLSDLSLASIVLQPDGKLLVSGVAPFSSPRRRVVARLSPEGCLDSSFGVSGLVFTDCPPFHAILCTWASVGLQADGKIVVAGSDDSDFLVARYLADGMPDTSFGGTGLVATDFSGQPDAAFGLALRTDGKIMVVGMTLGPGSFFGLARYNPDGTLDDSFGSFGKLIGDFAYNSVATSVALRPDGTFVVAGLSGAAVFGGSASLSTAQYLADSTVCPVNTLAATPQSQSLTTSKTGGDATLNPSAFRKLRDQKLAATPQGRRLVALYNEHSAEVTGLLLKDATLRANLLKGLLLWQPHVASLAEGNKRKPSAFRATAEQARVVDEVVERLTALGSRKLAQAIARERKTLPPGLSMADGLLRAIEQ